MADYTGIDRPYDALTNRAVGISPTVGNESSIFNEPAQASSSSDPTVGPESYIGIQTTPTAAGAVETRTVVTNESIGDVWINTFIRSQNFKPGAMGFNIDGQTGDAEFNNVTVRGTIYATLGEIGGWTINSTTITGGDATLDSTGVITLGTGNDIVKLTAVDSLYRMWVGNSSAVSAPFSITKAGAISATSGTIGGNVLSATSIGSPLFVSGPLGKGWNISSTGTAEFQDVTVRGIIRTSVFEKDTISAVNGLVLVSKADALDSDMTALDASTLTITGETTFVANEVIRIKDGTDDEWMLVTDASGAPTYVVTRDLAGSYAANNNPIWKKGTAVVSMGVGTGTKTGFVLLDSSSANSPYIDIYGRNSNTYTDYTLHGRFGWLKGITDADVGLATTDVWGLYTDNAYIKGVIVANTGYIGGTSGWTIAAGSISSVNGGNTTTMASGGTNAYIAGTTAAPQFIVTHAGALTATSATITGTINATAGYFGNVTNGITVDSTGTTITGTGYIRTDTTGARIEMRRALSGGVFTNGIDGYDSSNNLVLRLATGGSNPMISILGTANNHGMQILNSASGNSTDALVITEAGLANGIKITTSGTTARSSVAAIQINHTSTNGYGLYVISGSATTGELLHIESINGTPTVDVTTVSLVTPRSNQRNARITVNNYLQFPAYYHCSDFDEYLSAGNTVLSSTVIAKAYWVGGGTSGTQTLLTDSTEDKNSHVQLSTTSTASRTSTLTFGRYIATLAPAIEFRVKVSSITNTKINMGLADGTNDYAMLTFDTDLHASRFYTETRTAASTTSTQQTATIGTSSWFTVRIHLQGSIAYFYVDDVLIGSNSANVPVTNPMKPYFYIDNKAAAEEKLLNIDYVKVWSGRKDT